MSLLISFSALLNLSFIVALINVIHGRGGIAYLKCVWRKDNKVNPDTGLLIRREILASLPNPRSRPIVFLGDSLTAACEWPELESPGYPILNRGIGGDTSQGVLERISGICQLNPLGVFLMVGANDPQMLRLSPLESCTTIRAIVQALLQGVPDCRIFVQSILPSRTPKFVKWGAEANVLLAAMCHDIGIEYLNLRPSFLDSAGLLKIEYTYDGLHLTADGYRAWRQQVEKELIELRNSDRVLAAPAA